MTQYLTRQWARANWFLLLLPVLLFAELMIARSNDWSNPGFLEHAIIFDLCVFVPILYAACYRHRLSRPALMLRVIGLASLGIFIASQLVPSGAQQVLPHLGWGRMVGLAVLALIELKLVYEIIKLSFAGGTSAEALAQKGGVPSWAARLMLLEARFWKAVWKFLRRW